MYLYAHANPETSHPLKSHVVLVCCMHFRQKNSIIDGKLSAFSP